MVRRLPNSFILLQNMTSSIITIGKLVWDSSGFHNTAVKCQLINGHVLAAKLLRNDGKSVVDSWINLDSRIHCDDEVLVYDPEREKYGEIVWPWTMESYKIDYPGFESQTTTSSSFKFLGWSISFVILYLFGKYVV